MLRNLTSKINYHSILDNLGAVDFYHFEERSEYFFLYEEIIVDLATYAADLWNAFHNIPSAFYKISNYESEIWDTVIASMDDISLETLAEIDPGIERDLHDPHQIEQVKKKYRTKIERLTKAEVIDLMTWVLSMLGKYFEIKTGYDVMFSVFDELERNNSMLKGKNGELMHPQAADVF